MAEAPLTFKIDAIVVDEAQEIGKDKRGITLERVIRLAIRRYRGVRLFFSSPLRSNPEYLLNLFQRPPSDSIHFIEHQRPVTQNLVRITKVDGKPYAAKVELLSETKAVSLGDIELPFKFRQKYMAKFVSHFTAIEDVSILYCNRPSTADKAASELSDLVEDVGDDELSEFGEFLREEIHHYYRLAKMVRRGVAFHYANIPQIVRARIEELAKERKLRFICCTSTLLQGVNLPAKNIFIENPKTGQGESGKIRPGDFWNLIGRAGQLNHEFSGNVFCIYGKDWDSDPISGDRMMKIESAFHVALTERAAELAIWAVRPALSADGNEAWAEQAYANVYSDFVSTKQRLSDFVKEEPLRKHLADVDAANVTWYESKSLPDELFTRNMYVHPQRLEELAEIFRKADSLSGFIPLVPVADGAYENLANLFGLIDQVFIKSGTQRHRYFAFLALRWMRGVSIRELVRARLEWKKAPDEEKQVNEEIRELFQEIEEELRYRYVKYTSIYGQVLSAILEERGFHDEASKLLPLHIFLEFGASDRVLISLMSLGLSRTSALLLRNSVSLSPEMTTQDCQDYLNAINLERIVLPTICKQEISRIRGRSS